MMCAHPALALSKSQNLTSELDALRRYVVLALTYPAAPYTIAALIYGISPNMPMLINSNEYAIGATLRIPLSRLISAQGTAAVDHRTLDQSFSAYAFRMGPSWSIVDLLRASNSILSITGIGRIIRNAIVNGDRSISRRALSADANKADIYLLISAAGAAGQRYAEASETLFDIQRTGSDVESRAHWVARVMRALSWNICPFIALQVMDQLFDPGRPSSGRERFDARTRIASTLAYV